MNESAPNLESAADAALALTTDPQEFEARLDARTRVPPVHVDTFLGWDEQQLAREVEDATRVLRRFAEAVVAAVENPASADEFLRALDLKAISRDHDWRAIFSTIREQHAGGVESKRAVLIKYLQYLGFRKRLIEFIRAKKRGLEGTDEMRAVGVPTRNAAGGDMRGGFVRLPLGEPVDLELRDGAKIEMMLAGHLYRLIGARPPCLLDQHGVMCFLRPGRNLVGRHPESDIGIDPDFSDISRAHLIIEWREPDRVRVQDLSSRGTHLDAATLANATPALTAD